MNLQHFQAFLWLRWRLLVNQMRRGGSANAVIAVILAVLAVIAASGLFVAFFLVGWLALPLAVPAVPDVFLWVWDGLIVAFLFAWMLGLIIELQRSEVLSLDKFLHLPVSLRGVFLINYLSSLFSFTMLLFLPSMVALALGLTAARGPAGLLALPALAAFLLMVTALTYQFQGWLASLMVNKRRRRTVIVLVTGAFILLCQMPNMVNFYFQGSNASKQPSAAIAERNAQLADLDRDKKTFADGDKEYSRRLREINDHYKARVDAEDNQLLEQISTTIRWVNLAVPPGWLALGAAYAANDEVLPPLLATLVMGLIGAASLWRAYRTTLRLYTGQYTAGRRSALPVKVEAAPADKGVAAAAKPQLLEWHLPFVSEQAAAVALGGFRSLTRAPEAKMLLLTPFILLLVFASMSFARGMHPPELLRPLIAYGGMSMMLLTMGQIVGNQFGFDRGGFRVFVLSAAPRRDILLGKNLAAAPLALGLATVAIAFVAVVYPMRIDHVLALFPQLVTMYLLFCLLANSLSIVAPMPMRTGTLKPASVKVIPAVLQVVFALLFPLVLAPSLLPLGIEFAVGELTGMTWLPLFLVLALLECVLVLFIYRLVLNALGRLLQSRELRILETVTTKEE